jgi:hypothetical protein
MTSLDADSESSGPYPPECFLESGVFQLVQCLTKTIFRSIFQSKDDTYHSTIIQFLVTGESKTEEKEYEHVVATA